MNFVDVINSQPVGKDDLLQAASDIAEHRNDAELPEIAMYRIAQRFRDEPNKASAVCLRMLAMVRFVASSNSHGWTLPIESDGGIPTDTAVMAAAAVHPLVVVGNQLEFESSSFAARILELAATEGRA